MNDLRSHGMQVIKAIDYVKHLKPVSQRYSQKIREVKLTSDSLNLFSPETRCKNSRRLPLCIHGETRPSLDRLFPGT